MSSPRTAQRPWRGSIFLERAEVVAHESWAGAQQVLRVHAPRMAAAAGPGSFAHIRCDEHLPMRRPMSIMRTDTDAGTVEFLYKVVGTGSELLARHKPGETLSVLGPIGRGFEPLPDRPLALLLGGGVGIPPMVFLADRLRTVQGSRPLVIMGSEVPFPFRVRPSTIMVEGMPEGVIAGMPLLEEWGVPSRLTSQQGFAGCHPGYVTDLARAWLDRLAPEVRAREVAIYACGPNPMLQAVAAMAGRVRPSLPGLPGGVHGLCRWWLRRVHRAAGNASGAGDEARVRRRPGVRCRRGCLAFTAALDAFAAACTPQTARTPRSDHLPLPRDGVCRARPCVRGIGRQAKVPASAIG